MVKFLLIFEYILKNLVGKIKESLYVDIFFDFINNYIENNEYRTIGTYACTCKIVVHTIMEIVGIESCS